MAEDEVVVAGDVVGVAVDVVGMAGAVVGGVDGSAGHSTMSIGGGNSTASTAIAVPKCSYMGLSCTKSCAMRCKRYLY